MALWPTELGDVLFRWADMPPRSIADRVDEVPEWAVDAAQRTITIDGEPVTIPANGVHEQPVAAGSVEVQGEQLVIGVDYRSASEVGGFTASPQGPAAEGVLVLH
jgi:hypothetical protein